MRITPTVKEVRQARANAGLTQEQAARVVYVTLAAWQKWENPNPATGNKMPLAAYELFLLKTGQEKIN